MAVRHRSSGQLTGLHMRDGDRYGLSGGQLHDAEAGRQLAPGGDPRNTSRHLAPQTSVLTERVFRPSWTFHGTRDILPTDGRPMTRSTVLGPTNGDCPGAPAFDTLIERISAELADGDPRRALVSTFVHEAAARFADASVRTYISVLVERAARRDLACPDIVARTRWTRRTPCELRMRKWDGSPGRRTPVRPLREDGFGHWYLWPAGEPMLPRSGPPRTYDHDFVHLVPATGCWTARWGDDGDVDLYCDVTTRPEVGADAVAAIDLDLDVVRYHDGRTALVDQDQFAQRRTDMGYPQPVVDEALSTANWLHTAVSEGLEPFATVGARLLRN